MSLDLSSKKEGDRKEMSMLLTVPLKLVDETLWQQFCWATMKSHSCFHHPIMLPVALPSCFHLPSQNVSGEQHKLLVMMGSLRELTPI